MLALHNAALSTFCVIAVHSTSVTVIEPCRHFRNARTVTDKLGACGWLSLAGSGSDHIRLG